MGRRKKSRQGQDELPSTEESASPVPGDWQRSAPSRGGRGHEDPLDWTEERLVVDAARRDDFVEWT